jgi:hypothetical protein
MEDLRASVIVYVRGGASSSRDPPHDEYSFVCPKIHSIAPDLGSLKGGNQIVVSRAGLWGVDSVGFEFSCSRHRYQVDVVGGFQQDSKGLRLHLKTPDVLRRLQRDRTKFEGCHPPDLLANMVVHVTSGEGAGVSAIPNPPLDQHAFLGPHVNSVVPGSGQVIGGNRITVVGWGLSGVHSVQFDFPCSKHHYQIDQVGGFREDAGGFKLEVPAPDVLRRLQQHPGQFAGCNPKKLVSDIGVEVSSGPGVGVFSGFDPPQDRYTFKN